MEGEPLAPQHLVIQLELPVLYQVGQELGMVDCLDLEVVLESGVLAAEGMKTVGTGGHDLFDPMLLEAFDVLTGESLKLELLTLTA
jgi:hypothetical protein